MGISEQGIYRVWFEGHCTYWEEERDGNIEKSDTRFLEDGLDVGQKQLRNGDEDFKVKSLRAQGINISTEHDRDVGKRDKELYLVMCVWRCWQ